MKQLLTLEEIAMAAACIFLLTQHNLGLSFWIWLPLFFSPDLGMLGYLLNNRIGAICYNAFHHKGLALLLAFLGYYFTNETLLASGLLLFAHSSFDRIMGYGLKYFSGFANTHLGEVGKQHSSAAKAASYAA